MGRHLEVTHLGLVEYEDGLVLQDELRRKVAEGNVPDQLLLLEHPTRGLDVESAAYVWQRLLERRSDGTSIIFASADIDELLRYSDRILVFFSGQVIAELEAGRTNVDEIGHLIGGRTAMAQPRVEA